MFDAALFAKMEERVEKIPEAGCWLWTGSYHAERKYAANQYGYMTVKLNGKWQAKNCHRLMWIALHGDPGRKLEVCHRCDVPLCCNPAHLFLGTHKENMADSRRKGRHFLSAKTHCKRGHELTAENTYVEKKTGCRHCNICHMAQHRRRAGWPEHLLFIPPGKVGERPPELARKHSGGGFAVINRRRAEAKRNAQTVGAKHGEG